MPLLHTHMHAQCLPLARIAALLALRDLLANSAEACRPGAGPVNSSLSLLCAGSSEAEPESDPGRELGEPPDIASKCAGHAAPVSRASGDSCACCMGLSLPAAAWA